MRFSLMRQRRELQFPWRPGAVLRPAVVADDDLDATPDVQTLPSQLDHEPEGVL